MATIIRRDGRSLLLCLVAAGCLIVISLFFTYGYEKTWQLWNIPTMMPYLADARGITAGAETYALGYDPMVTKRGLAKQLNYPRVWHLLFKTGIDQSDTIYFGVIFAILFLSSIFLITKNIDRPTACLMTFAIFSPAVLFGLERGNNDLFVFSLVALAAYAIKKSPAWTAVIVGFAFLLKLYPIFVLSMFLRERKRVFLAIMATAIVVCGSYSVVMRDELKLISRTTPRPMRLDVAYGLNVAWMRAGMSHPHAGMALRTASYAVVLLAAACSLYYTGRRLGAANDRNGHLDSFRAGAAVYIGTFLLGSNWDYRLMFLLLVIPQLMSWRRSPSKGVRYVAITTIISVMISLWNLFNRRILGHFAAGLALNNALNVSCKWIVFSGLLYLFIFSLPDWLKLWPPDVKAASQEPAAV